MDKPLSQEQLSEGDLANHIGHLAVGLDSKGYERLQIIVNEIKRLQAIEAERDNFKLGLDSIGLVAFGELKSGSQNKAIETVCRLVYEFIEGVNAK